MNWGLVAWTAVGWLISGGLLYLTYQLGRDAGLAVRDRRDAWQAWKSGLLAVVVLFAAIIFGTGGGPDSAEPSYHVLGNLIPADWSRMLGILIAFVCAYSVGFFDGRRARRRR